MIPRPGSTNSERSSRVLRSVVFDRAEICITSAPFSIASGQSASSFWSCTLMGSLDAGGGCASPGLLGKLQQTYLLGIMERYIEGSYKARLVFFFVALLWAGLVLFLQRFDTWFPISGTPQEQRSRVQTARYLQQSLSRCSTSRYLAS